MLKGRLQTHKSKKLSTVVLSSFFVEAEAKAVDEIAAFTSLLVNITCTLHKDLLGLIIPSKIKHFALQ